MATAKVPERFGKVLERSGAGMVWATLLVSVVAQHRNQHFTTKPASAAKVPQRFGKGTGKVRGQIPAGMVLVPPLPPDVGVLNCELFPPKCSAIKLCHTDRSRKGSSGQNPPNRGPEVIRAPRSSRILCEQSRLYVERKGAQSTPKWKQQSSSKETVIYRKDFEPYELRRLKVSKTNV